jgi:hypothetical protein
MYKSAVPPLDFAQRTIVRESVHSDASVPTMKNRRIRAGGRSLATEATFRLFAS